MVDSIRRIAGWLWPVKAQGVRHSMRGKLMWVVVLTTTAALLLAGGATLLRDLDRYRNSQSAELMTEVDILSLATAPTLAFDDRGTAARILGGLQTRPAVFAAALYDTQGVLFARYTRGNGSIRLPERPGPRGLRVIGNRIELTKTVVDKGEWLGTIYLASTYDVSGALRDYAGILALVTVLSLAVALVLSTLFQRALTAPLDAMANVARQVVGTRDYSLRASKTTQDEVGVVVEAFNSMLDEVQDRTRALEATNSALAESEARFRETFEIAPLGIANVAPDGSFLLVNDRMCSIVGYSREELLSRTFADITHPQDLEADWRNVHDLLSGKAATYSMEKRYLNKNGGTVWANLAVSLLRDVDGQPQYMTAVVEDIGQRKSTEEALREADKRKDVFIATLAHELRNPLAPLRIAGRLLASPALTPAQLEETRAIIGRQTSHMALLLDDLLDASRITRGALELKKDIVDLAECVAAAVEAAKPLFDRKRHHLSVLAAAEPIVLEADPVRLTQIVTNLLTNAGKYTDPGGEVLLRSEIQDRFAVVSVRDSGIGLAPEAIPKLFEMFFQIQGAGTRTEGGLGIGLALAKGLVTLHGGRIEAHSEGLGRGSEFRVYLPRTVRALGAAEENPDDGQIKSASTRRVLVVDDNRDAADGLALFLEIAGHEVAVAYNGSDALSVADRIRPQLLLLDIGMPGMNGYELARRIRDRPWSARCVLVAITGWGQEEDKRRAEQAGFDRHMTKPIDPAAIQTLLHDLDRA